MSLASISTLPNRTETITDELLQLGQSLINRGYARLQSLYARHINGQSSCTVVLALPAHAAVLRLVNTGTSVACHCDHVDGRSDVVAIASESMTSALSAIETYLRRHSITHAA